MSSRGQGQKPCSSRLTGALSLPSSPVPREAAWGPKASGLAARFQPCSQNSASSAPDGPCTALPEQDDSGTPRPGIPGDSQTKATAVVSNRTSTEIWSCFLTTEPATGSANEACCSPDYFVTFVSSIMTILESMGSRTKSLSGPGGGGTAQTPALHPRGTPLASLASAGGADTHPDPRAASLLGGHLHMSSRGRTVPRTFLVAAKLWGSHVSPGRRMDKSLIFTALRTNVLQLCA